MPKRKQPKLSKLEAIEQLNLLKIHPGWLIIVKALEANIEQAESDIEKAAVIEDPVKYNVVMKELQNKKADRKEMQNLPDSILEELKEGGDDSEPLDTNLDPYA